MFGSIDDAAVPSGKLTAPLVKNNLQTLASNPPPSLVHADSILNSLLTRLLLSLSIPLLLQTLSFSSGRRISTSRRWLTCAGTSLWTRAHTRYSALLRKRKEAASPYPPRQSRLLRPLPLLAGGSSTTTTTTASRRATASMALAAGDHPLPHPSNRKRGAVLSANFPMILLSNARFDVSRPCVLAGGRGEVGVVGRGVAQKFCPGRGGGGGGVRGSFPSSQRKHLPTIY